MELFSFFLAHFLIFIEHNSNDESEELARYEIGIRRLRLLRRIAEPFAWGPLERAREFGELLYAFLAPIADNSRSPDMPPTTCFEYLAGSVVNHSRVTLFAYVWFDSLQATKEYVEKRKMTVIGGWNEQD